MEEGEEEDDEEGFHTPEEEPRKDAHPSSGIERELVNNCHDFL